MTASLGLKLGTWPEFDRRDNDNGSDNDDYHDEDINDDAPGLTMICVVRNTDDGRWIHFRKPSVHTSVHTWPSQSSAFYRLDSDAQTLILLFSFRPFVSSPVPFALFLPDESRAEIRELRIEDRGLKTEA
ncbi:hypothetical protein GQX73_g7540 [Xylaria multiplex]|uniref:Uncharacterized protein n=1 Tax=Xylaria multiplex TaxID=323545 RepID=A0A7C8MQT7_9PEZI|nr:hypothetical protein GQX73_g7540 [Xylaria multiplex]